MTLPCARLPDRSRSDSHPPLASAHETCLGRSTEPHHTVPPLTRHREACPRLRQAHLRSPHGPATPPPSSEPRSRPDPRDPPKPIRSPLALLLSVVLVVLTPSPPAEARRAVYAWPLAPPHPVLRPFTAPTTPYGPGHRGVDLGGSAGEPVLAAADGTVLFAGEVGGRTLVSLAHDDGLRTTYEPVNPSTRAGAPARRGEPIGSLLPGHAGCPRPACLHWGARRGQEYVNPLRLVSPGRVRLLPVPPATSG